MMKALLKPTTAGFLKHAVIFSFFLFLTQISFGQTNPDMPDFARYKVK